MSTHLSIGTRVRFIGRGWSVRAYTDQVGVIIDKNLHTTSYNYHLEGSVVFVSFDIPILGKREHFCAISYLELEKRTPEEEDRIRRQQHAMKYF